MNEQASKNTSKMVMRGLETRVLGGFSTGHCPYGYDSKPTRFTERKGVQFPSHFEILIDPIQAGIVVRMFTLFAEGNTPYRIAKIFNKEGIAPPQGSRGNRKSKGWATTTVRNMIYEQKKYFGIWSYRHTKVIKNPAADTLAQKERPASEWLDTEREDLRIVSRELEKLVYERKKYLEEEKLKTMKEFSITKKQVFAYTEKDPTHMLIGSLACGCCGGNMIVASGKSGGYVGCFHYYRKTTTPCKNKKMKKISIVEDAVIVELKKQLDNEETYAYMAKEYNRIMSANTGDVPIRIQKLDESISELESALENYNKFIRQGNFSEIIVSNLNRDEKKLKELKNERKYLEEQTNISVFITPALIKKKMQNLAEILSKNVSEVNSLMRRVFPDKITMTPEKIGKDDYYNLSGAINLNAVMGNIGGKYAANEVSVPFVQFQTRL
ncbi:MAG: recombinase family protein [Bacteriovoracia bacterium]